LSQLARGGDLVRTNELDWKRPVDDIAAMLTGRLKLHCFRG